MKKPTRTILIVENDVSVQATTAHHLVNVGYNVHTSVNGAGMFLALWKEYPDLILLNPNLPDGDGLDYAQQILKQTDVPIVIATASQNREDRIKVLGFGVADYLTRPIDPKELILRIRNILNRSENVAGHPETHLHEHVTGLKEPLQ